MTKTLKKLLPFAFLLIIISFILVGCTQTVSGDKLVLVSSAQDLIFREGETPDLTKISFSILDSNGQVKETVYATQEMLSVTDINKLSKKGEYSIVINYNNLRLNVPVKVLKSAEQTIEYKVYFDCNEAYGANNTPNRGSFDESILSVLEAPSDYILGDKLIKLAIPKLNGFIFKGWYADRFGTGNKLTLNESNPYTLSSGTTTFYAQWEDQRKFTVRFVHQITNQELESQVVEYGKAVILPSTYKESDPPRLINNKYYVFKGWQAEGGASLTNIKQNLIVYAVFEEQKVTVTFYKADKVTEYVKFDVVYGGSFNRDDIPAEFYEGEYSEASHTAVWIDTNTEDPLPYQNISNIKKPIKIYIQYTPKPMTLTFYKITKEAFDAYGGGAIPPEYKDVIEISYGRTLSVVPSSPLFADDPQTDIDESKKYNSAWRVYNGDIPSVPNFSAPVVANIDFFVLYTVKTITVTFLGYGDQITRSCNYGDRIISPTISSITYNPLVYQYNWHKTATLDNEFDFNTPITENISLYFKVVSKNINVYYCMPSYYSDSGAGVYTNPINYEVNTTLKMITIKEDSGYDIYYSKDIADILSQRANNPDYTAYALSHQVVATNSGDQRPSYVFHKYRQDTYNNGTTKWYDYNNNVWDFSGNYYEKLKEYMIRNDVAHVVLYAAVSTNEQVVKFSNVSYTSDNQYEFVPIKYGTTLIPLTLNYGDSFNPNEYIKTLTSLPENPLVIAAPQLPDVQFSFGGWYTTPNYLPDTKVLEGRSITITADTTFYAKWINSDTGSAGLVFQRSADNYSYEVVGYNYPAEGEDLLRIPQYYDGQPVTAIKAGAFDVQGIGSIKEIELRNTLTSIDEGVFTSFYGLTAFIIKNNNSNYFTVIDGTLYTKDMSVLIKCPAAYSSTTFTVPAQVVRIAKEAFALCANIIEVSFENESVLNTIAEKAFWECESLVAVYLPVSLQYIEERAFYESAKLNTINLAAASYDILHVGELAFGGTRWLANRTGQIILGNVLVMYREDGNNLISLVINDNVSTIADGAFSQQAVSLTIKAITFTVNSSIQRIGNLSFNACPDLSEIYIKCDTLVTIAEDSFSGISMNAILYVNTNKYNDYIEAYESDGIILLGIDKIKVANNI